MKHAGGAQGPCNLSVLTAIKTTKLHLPARLSRSPTLNPNTATMCIMATATNVCTREGMRTAKTHAKMAATCAIREGTVMSAQILGMIQLEIPVTNNSAKDHLAQMQTAGDARDLARTTASYVVSAFTWILRTSATACLTSWLRLPTPVTGYATKLTRW